jgi:uncharacterized damage-inducible protein DinB
MPHPLVLQLRFTRSELLRALAGLSEQDARRRLLPMNCISWTVGHLAWQEQRYFLTFAQGRMPAPELNQQFAFGAPACTPPLAEVRATWQAVTSAADEWLEQITTEGLLHTYTTPDGAWSTSYGNLLQRVIYHYWYHIGEVMAVRQQLGHRDLPDFVGNIDDEAPFLPS